MRIALLSGGTGWHVQDLQRAATASGHAAEILDFRGLSACAPSSCTQFDSLSEFDAAIIRTMPAGSLEQIVFRMDLLQGAYANGLKVLNPPRAVEVCVDKFLTNVRLLRAGMSVPETIACQRADDALQAFDSLGRDVVVKPLFGAEGRGMVRVTDPELAWRTFRAIEQLGGVIYLQRFIQHPGWDLRVFVLGQRVIAAMRRSSRGDWRTNVAQGGFPEQTEIGAEQRRLALHAAAIVGTPLAGVDLMQGPDGAWYVIEVNAVPGWRAIASVCSIDIADLIVRYLVEEYQV